MTGIWIVTGCLIVVVAGLVILLVEKSSESGRSAEEAETVS